MENEMRSMPALNRGIHAYNSRPLATFALISYNQEKFIEEAVKGAFAQTYEPLEIILSDDCSNDRTFDIIQELAAKYSGPHQLILNRNSINIGIGDHVNIAMKLANGDFIIAAAGDDISFPIRTEHLVNYFLKNKNFYSVYSNVIIIEADGKTHRSWLPENYKHYNKPLFERCVTGVGVLGCAHAWKKEVFDVFGPINEKVVREDLAIPYRSSLLGDIGYLDEVLGYYRRHDQNIYKRENEMQDVYTLRHYREIHAVGMLGVRKTMSQDLALYLNRQNADLSKYKREIIVTKKMLMAAQIEVDIIGCKTAICKLSLLLKAGFYKVGFKKIMKLIVMEFFPAILLLKRHIL